MNVSQHLRKMETTNLNTTEVSEAITEQQEGFDEIVRASLSGAITLQAHETIPLRLDPSGTLKGSGSLNVSRAAARVSSKAFWMW